ncbi:Iron/zinc purple acid phosphatase-like C-terminal domain-containing protein [Cynara cardunculus var. scolymus]|uniref:Purple acid phosphatase n=1 Tax=Cynara cardunculus var. scolymus TaxID=59895 RepID=A0A103XWF7_CYNCS|nr:Iron/zinc purple acid phosphatase-like C-terminal domain-containing protein [Cynara cardunculus var. scolymus]
MPTMDNLFTVFLLLSSKAFLWRVCHASSHSSLIRNDLGGRSIDEQPLAKIAIYKAVILLHESASIQADPLLLGLEGEDTSWVNVELKYPEPSENDWVGVFSPAKFKYCSFIRYLHSFASFMSACKNYMFANHSNSNYVKTGNATLRFQIINQRADFSFALFTGGVESPKLVAISDPISFVNPKAPLYPRLAQGKAWDEMTVTWTSGYNIDEAVPFVEWGWKGHSPKLSPAGTLTFTRGSMIGHMLLNGSIVWSKMYSFKSSPYPGQDSLQRVIIFGDMGKAERDGSNEYASYQPGSLITTDQLIGDLDNYDIVFHIGDLPYANGFISQWDHGNHERSWPNSGSFYDTTDSGGEYSTDYGMFHFCIADSEHDWREGSEQYAWIEMCLASVDRQKQPWLIFSAHRVLGYSSNSWYAMEGSFEEPMGREHLQKLWQKYKVDIAFYGHNKCVKQERYSYSGTVNGTIHVVVGGGGSHLSDFTEINTVWSLHKDHDWGFVKLTAFNHSSLLFEYKKSRDGVVYDNFTISRDYKDVLACVHDGCEPTTLAT